jgi:hypothetical protein
VTRILKTASFLYFLLAVAGMAFTAEDPQIGAWKLYLANSQLSGISYSKASGVLRHCADGSMNEYDFAIDGREYEARYSQSSS